LNPGGKIYVWGLPATTPPSISDRNLAVEEVAAGTASMSVCLATGTGFNSPPMVCIEIHFDSDPGVAEIDIQEAESDADAYYITPAAAAYTVVPTRTGNINTRVDLSPTGGGFLRLFMKTLPNDADCWASIRRLA
jgi:hypothetical protein